MYGNPIRPIIRHTPLGPPPPFIFDKNDKTKNLIGDVMTEDFNGQHLYKPQDEVNKEIIYSNGSSGNK